MNQLDRIANALALQRNDALNQLAVSTAVVQEKDEAISASFEALHQCILSGQVPHQDAPKLVASVPGFAAWRDAKTAKDTP